jgi:hypothetical protein
VFKAAGIAKFYIKATGKPLPILEGPKRIASRMLRLIYRRAQGSK